MIRTRQLEVAGLRTVVREAGGLADPRAGQTFVATTSRLGSRLLLKHGNPWGLPRRQRETCPTADVVVQQDSGHWPFADDPARVAEQPVRLYGRVLRQCGRGLRTGGRRLEARPRAVPAPASGR